MDRRYHSAKFFLMIMLACGSVASAAPVPRAPTSKWVVNFAESQCLASRNYGPPDKPLLFALKPSPLGEVMQISVVRKGKWGDAIQVPITMRFDSLEPIRSTMLAFTLLKDGVRINHVNLPLQTFARMRQAKSISMRSTRELNESFELTQMVPVLKALDRCVVGLQQDWNIGEVNSAKLKQRAKPSENLASYFQDSDYPGVAIHNNEEGTVNFALLIDETGKIADCMVIGTSGVAALDAQTCAVLTSRAKFVPAVGVGGQPTKDAFVGQIRWAIR